MSEGILQDEVIRLRKENLLLGQENAVLKEQVSICRNLAGCWKDMFNHLSEEVAALKTEVGKLQKEEEEK